MKTFEIVHGVSYGKKCCNLEALYFSNSETLMSEIIALNIVVCTHKKVPMVEDTPLMSRPSYYPTTRA